MTGDYFINFGGETKPPMDGNKSHETYKVYVQHNGYIGGIRYKGDYPVIRLRTVNSNTEVRRSYEEQQATISSHHSK
jgi:hypothetical protein